MTSTAATDESPGPRTLVQPGPASPDRVQSVIGELVEITGLLEAGLPIRQSIAKLVEESGVDTGSVRMDGLQLEPMRFVQPTYADSDAHVAYYSHTHAPDGRYTMDFATATLGLKDGEPFIHCHALWDDPDGRRRGGHISPDEAIVAEPTEATVYGARGVSMMNESDAETNFSLFGVVGRTGSNAQADGARRLIVAKVRPNEDFVESVEQACAIHNVSRGVVRGAIGSTVGAQFEGQPLIEEVPTELMVIDGRIDPGADGQPIATMTTALIDADGAVYTGTLQRNVNPVLICIELFIEVL